MDQTTFNLTISIPVYNRENNLIKCFDSINNTAESIQENVEIVIVNDGSTDLSQEVIDGYQWNDCFSVTCITKENGGVSSARNTGLINSSGKFIWFIDPDDYIEPSRFAELLSLLSTTSSQYITIDAEFINNSGESIKNCTFSEFESNEIVQFKFSESELSGSYRYHMPWLRIYSRELIKDIKFDNVSSHEDVLFDFKVLAKKPHIQHSRISLYYYNFDSFDSITNNVNEKRIIAYAEVYSILEKYFIEQNCGDLKVFYNVAQRRLMDYYWFLLESDNQQSYASLKKLKPLLELLAYLSRKSGSQNLFSQSRNKVVHYLVRYLGVNLALRLMPILSGQLK